MERKLALLQQMLECTCGMQLACIRNSKDDLMELVRQRTSPIFDLLLNRDDLYWSEILDMPARPDTVYEFTAPVGVNVFTYTDEEHSRLFLFGPVLTQPYSGEKILRLLTEYDTPAHVQNLILQFYASLPVIPADRVYRIVETSLRQILKLEYPLKISQASSLYSVDNLLRTSLPRITPEIAQMRQIEVRYEYSAALIEAIKQGNMSLAFHILGQYIPGSDNPIRNQNPLRNAQNYCIVMNTQLRHAMEECGIHPYRVDQLSNEIGLQIEQLTEVSKLRDFFIYVIRQYCRLVQQHAYPNLNPLTNLTVEYIKEHLTENLTVKDTAKALTVNPDYLSAQFHANMGISFIDFVNRERVHQAAALLSSTHLQIQQISQIVGYNNTSYFAKQFSRYIGVSPRHYRSQHNPHA